MIIDIHSHLGDILYPDGGNLIFKKGLKKKIIIDLISLAELGLYKTNPISEWILKNLFENRITKACQARNRTATLENMRRSMNEAGVEKTACMPIPPNLMFEDLKRAFGADSGIIPFTGIDFTRRYGIETALRQNVAQGARGLKLHPIIQKEPLSSKRTLEAVEAFAPHNLPVLFHSGVQSYYLGQEKDSKQDPSYGELQYARDLVSTFPNVPFIAGHAGLFQYKDTMALLGGFKNVYVDTSFQSPDKIMELIGVFGPERVMYGSDWPWGSRTAAMAATKKACRGDKGLENLLFTENAARLLRLPG